MADPREIATDVLHRVATGGAWAAPTLDASLARGLLAERDARLCAALVYGTLRCLPSLDAELDEHLRDPQGIDPYTRAALRVGAFQVFHLPRVPVRAAVHETVGLVKRKRGRLAKLTNAVLRKLRRPEDCAPPTRTEVPAWVRERVNSLGRERADAFLGERALPPPLHLELFADRSAWIATARLARPDAEIVPLGPERSVSVTRVGDPRTLPGFDDGAFRVQDLGSMRIARLCGVQAGERVLDACAGRGGKTVTFAHAAGTDGEVVAVDLHEARVERVHEELRRLGLPGVRTETIDWTVGDGGLEGGFDHVIVDAPCTGLGTVHRRPEILLRLTPDSAEELAKVQQAILSGVAGQVRPGGDLVFAVCSPDPAEAWVTPGEGFIPHPMPGADPDGVLRLGPWPDHENSVAHDCDAYQVCRWRRA